MAVVLVFPDLQIPFEHADALPFLKEVQNYAKPDAFVNIGDEVDFYAISQYVKSPDAMSFEQEYAKALGRLQEYYKLWPNVQVCISNHTWRPYKLAYNSGLPSRFLKSIPDVLQAPKGWQWKEFWEIDKVIYEHGDAVSGNHNTIHRNLWQRRQQSVVFGHHHSAFGTVWHRTQSRGKQHRGFTCGTGCLIDESAYAFKYVKGPQNVQLGCVVVEHGIPWSFVMFVDKHNRWTGRLTP